MKLVQILIWVTRTGLEILSPNGWENWDLKLVQISICVTRTGLEILSPNGSGKIVCLIVSSYLYEFDH